MGGWGIGSRIQDKVKAWLAESIVPTMSLAMFNEVDPNGEMLSWMNDIGSMLAPAAVPIDG